VPDVGNKLHFRGTRWIINWENEMGFKETTFTLKAKITLNKLIEFITKVKVTLSTYYKVSGGPITKT